MCLPCLRIKLNKDLTSLLSNIIKTYNAVVITQTISDIYISITKECTEL